VVAGNGGKGETKRVWLAERVVGVPRAKDEPACQRIRLFQRRWSRRGRSLPGNGGHKNGLVGDARRADHRQGFMSIGCRDAAEAALPILAFEVLEGSARDINRTRRRPTFQGCEEQPRWKIAENLYASR
jgi:hypothetical protein